MIGRITDSLCQTCLTAKAFLSVRAQFPSAQRREEGLIKDSRCHYCQSSNSEGFERDSQNGTNKLTHIGERSPIGRWVEWAGRRRQLRGAITLRHAEYGVGVAPSWFAFFTL